MFWQVSRSASSESALSPCHLPATSSHFQGTNSMRYQLYHFRGKRQKVFHFNNTAQEFLIPNTSYCEIVTANIN